MIVFTILFGLEYSLSVVSGIALTMLSVNADKDASTVKLNSIVRWNKDHG